METDVKSFKQWLLEGGAATADAGTSRASKADINDAIKFVHDHAGFSMKELQDGLVGSGPLVLSGIRGSAGDIDIAIEGDKDDHLDALESLARACDIDVPKPFGTTYSFPVPTSNNKVQVDIMLVPNLEWAKWYHHSAPNSQYKGGVRNELLRNTAIQTLVPGEDVVVRNDENEPLVRARRSLTNAGLRRIFKSSRNQDGTWGKTMKKVTPEELQQHLDVLNKDIPFSHKEDRILDPRLAAKMMFGDKIKPADLMSAEQVLAALEKHPKKDSILKATKIGLEKQGLPPLKIK